MNIKFGKNRLYNFLIFPFWFVDKGILGWYLVYVTLMAHKYEWIYLLDNEETERFVAPSTERMIEYLYENDWEVLEIKKNSKTVLRLGE